VVAGLEEAKKPIGESPPPDSGLFDAAEFGKNRANLSSQFAASADSRFQLEKSTQLFICTHNETFSIAAMCVRNPDCSPVRING
jgi:hypothetical protein